MGETAARAAGHRSGPATSRIDLGSAAFFFTRAPTSATCQLVGNKVQFNFSNRQQALIVIGERDFESHLIAIRDLLRRNKEADAATAEKIEKLAKQLRASGGGDPEEGMYLDDYYADEAYRTAFQDAAHSSCGDAGAFDRITLCLNLRLLAKAESRQSASVLSRK